MERLTFDFETRSRCDLRKAGAYKYSLDPSTQPTCLAIKSRASLDCFFLEFEQINLPWKKQPRAMQDYWIYFIQNSFEFTAHNAFFERCIYENILVRRLGWPIIPPRQYRCTAAKAAACSLPRALGNAAEAMKLHVQKDKWGYVAMMKTCKPRRDGTFLEVDEDSRTWKTLYDYCKIDVLAEEALDKALPDLSLDEQEIWFLNQELNWRGLRIDIPTVKKIVEMIALESTKKLKELDSLTMGLVTKAGARDSILEFLALEGVKLPNLQKQTVEDALTGFELSEDMHRLLELRKALTLTSTKKYQAFLNRSGEDERVRDILMYHGAHTGRDTGTGVQPQNFPRLSLATEERPYAPVENIVDSDHETLQLLYGDSLGVLFSSVLRNMIIASGGHELFVVDFAKIEVAVLWWLAGNERGLKVLRDGLDPYKYMAVANTGSRYQDISDGSPERQLGKAQVLGCGFGMGWAKFQKTAWDLYRLKLTEFQSRKAVDSYRKANPDVPELWKTYERAAVSAVEKTQNHSSKCTFIAKDNFLWIILPSGRSLAYREPQIAWRENERGPQQTLEFWAVNSKTKKWSLERTWGGSLTENIVQAVARDLLMHAMLRLKKAGFIPLLTVHDEAICEAPKGERTLKEFTEIFCEVPPWAKGLPIEAKGYTAERYRK